MSSWVTSSGNRVSLHVTTGPIDTVRRDDLNVLLWEPLLAEPRTLSENQWKTLRPLEGRVTRPPGPSTHLQRVYGHRYGFFSEDVYGFTTDRLRIGNSSRRKHEDRSYGHVRYRTEYSLIRAREIQTRCTTRRLMTILYFPTQNGNHTHSFERRWDELRFYTFRVPFGVQDGQSVVTISTTYSTNLYLIVFSFLQ